MSTMTTFAQAIRNAIEVERAAARFYSRLVDQAGSAEVRAFFVEMVAQEEAHAREIAGLGERVQRGELPRAADDDLALVETAPGWGEAVVVALEDAVGLAIEAEHHAALYYDAMADFLVGETAAFFRALGATELAHASRLTALLERLVRDRPD
jgi:rubrerythrin